MDNIEYLRLKYSIRISLLSGRQRENRNIIKKLERQLRNLDKRDI